MRTAKRKKVRMYYSNFVENSPVYVRDSEGNIVYQTMPDGTSVPKKTGQFQDTFEEPTVFYNSITGELTQDEWKAFGHENYGSAVMTYNNGEFPFVAGTLIWKDSAIGYKEDGTVDESTADYRIMGIDKTGQYFTRVVMEEVQKTSE